MYIIKTISKSKTNSSDKYYTYRMMESLRVGDKVKKITLLNLGSDFSVEQKDWRVLSDRVSDIINQTPSLFEVDSVIESLAQHYAIKIIASKAKVVSSGNGDGDKSIQGNENKYKEIDTTTIKNSNPKTIGVEHILYETIRELELRELFGELGLTNIQINSAIGTLIAKATNPSSEAKAFDWLCSQSALNELMGCDFNQYSSNAIYRISDKLYAHKEKIEQHLYAKQKKIFNYEETITLYDLTNTYFEGGAKGVERASRGRSKEKRSDAPLITLGVMLDSSGFVRKSEIFDGNVSEPKTFQGMLDKLRVPAKAKSLLSAIPSLVVMDAGIATQENIDYLVANNYEYIVVSRKREKEFDETKATPVKLGGKSEVLVRAQKVINEETNEIELFVHSKAKEAKEEAMQTRIQTLFLQKLQYLKDGLHIKKRTKEYPKVVEAIGRLKEKYSAIAQHYAITITKDPKGENAIDIAWNQKRSLDKKSTTNGVYCLRSNNTTMDEKTLWKTYTTLTDLEAVFRSLKSELGLRPIFHQRQSRVDGHLFITLLAYSIIHTIRYKLKREDIHSSWSTIRDILSSRVRVTTSMQCKDGTTLHIRQSTEPTEKQKEIYNTLKLNHQAGEVTHTTL